jgi:hypothetical protein
MPRRRSPGRRVLAALIVWAAGCEALVDGKLGDVDCLDEGAHGPPSCQSGYWCSDGLCIPYGLDAPCTGDDDCAMGDFCLDLAAFSAPPGSGVDLPSAAGRRCSRTCCSSGDCDPQFVCTIAPDGAGNFCQLATDVGRPAGGALDAMHACTQASDCRSGLCLGSRCADTCCSDTSCAAGAGDAGEGACRLGQPAPELASGFWCAVPAGQTGRYGPCKMDAECASGLCLDLGGDVGMVCSSPCCTSGDCGSAGPATVRCVTVEGVRACAALAPSPPGAAVGLTCATDSDCRGGICLKEGDQGTCSDTCCSDQSCGDTASLGCRPASVDGGWALRCEPK